VAVGDLLFIRPGARVPVDAVFEVGESEVDESTVTGESMPVSKSPGSELIGATINRNGTVRALVTQVCSLPPWAAGSRRERLALYPRSSRSDCRCSGQAEPVTARR
jgi:P-type E1-E2 ATPase